MTFRVWHAKNTMDPEGFGAGLFGWQAATFPDDFRHVATVETADLSNVFHLTNHIDSPWTENLAVAIPPGVDPATVRSTSVGDVIEEVNGRRAYHLVAPVGFTTLEPLDENFQTVVPAVYPQVFPQAR